MINGSPAGYFGGSRGLRQGDPLSLYLFVLGMEAFSLLVDKVVEGNYISRYKFKGRNGLERHITHLLFTDDTLVFYKDTKEQMSYLSRILVWFCHSIVELETCWEKETCIHVELGNFIFFPIWFMIVLYINRLFVINKAHNFSFIHLLLRGIRARVLT